MDAPALVVLEEEGRAAVRVEAGEEPPAAAAAEEEQEQEQAQAAEEENIDALLGTSLYAK